MSEFKRIEWVDLARAIAILCVILCHVVGSYYDFTVKGLAPFSLSSKLFALSTLTFGRFGVALFLMLTGYLLLDRAYDKEKTSKFWSKTKHLIVCMLFWSVLCELFVIFVLHKDITWISALLSVLTLKPYDLNHLWYLPMIVGMYILIPFAANALKEYDCETILKPLIFFAVLAFIVPFSMFVLEVYGIGGMVPQLSMGFSGGRYGVYIILGYIIKRDYFKKYKTSSIAAALIITLIAYLALQMFFYNQGHILRNYYDSPFLLIASTCLFELLSRISHVKFYSIVKPIAKYAFAIFLVHNFILAYLSPFIPDVPINNSIKVFIFFAVVFAITFVITIVIARIPKFGKYVLYLK